MKKLHQSFDIDSHSTREKQRRFRRQSTSKSPRSTSNKSNQGSLSKFWVRNLKPTVTGTELQSIIGVEINRYKNWSPPRRQPTPAKQKSQMRANTTLPQLAESQQKQIKDMKIQMEKYQIYIRRQNEKIAELGKKNQILSKANSVLQQKLKEKQERVRGVEEELRSLGARMNQKDMLLDILQKEQSAIKKVKTTIFQTRALEYQKQRQQQTLKIKQLQLQIQHYKSSKPPLKSCSSFPNTSLSPSPSYPQSDYKQNYDQTLKQLYETKQEIKRLQIAAACTERKHIKQLQLMKERKEKDYEELRKKFVMLLEKYRVNMKKVASQQIRSYKEKNGRSDSKDSIDSLAFSSDDQHRV